MRAAPGENGAIVSSVPSLLISAGCMDPWVQRYERVGHTYIKSFSYLFQKIFNQSLSEMPTRCLMGCYGTVNNNYFYFFLIANPWRRRPLMGLFAVDLLTNVRQQIYV